MFPLCGFLNGELLNQTYNRITKILVIKSGLYLEVSSAASSRWERLQKKKNTMVFPTRWKLSPRVRPPITDQTFVPGIYIPEEKSKKVKD